MPIALPFVKDKHKMIELKIVHLQPKENWDREALFLDLLIKEKAKAKTNYTCVICWDQEMLIS